MYKDDQRFDDQERRDYDGYTWLDGSPDQILSGPFGIRWIELYPKDHTSSNSTCGNCEYAECEESHRCPLGAPAHFQAIDERNRKGENDDVGNDVHYADAHVGDRQITAVARLIDLVPIVAERRAYEERNEYSLDGPADAESDSAVAENAELLEDMEDAYEREQDRGLDQSKSNGVCDLVCNQELQLVLQLIHTPGNDESGRCDTQAIVCDCLWSAKVLGQHSAHLTYYVPSSISPGEYQSTEYQPVLDLQSQGTEESRPEPCDDCDCCQNGEDNGDHHSSTPFFGKIIRTNR
jgi:hypothetical protein